MAATRNLWNQLSRRTGVLGMKVGMVPAWTKWGERLALTVLQVDDCRVVQVKTEEKEGYNALQLGSCLLKAKRAGGTKRGHFAKAGLEPRRHVREFRVTEDALLSVGTALSARHFVAGQYVDVQGTTIGKGFQGGMKLHNFKGQPASHGNSKTHRHMGSTGASTSPGKVWRGKKMPGRMGGHKQTTLNLRVYRIDPLRNLIYVKGAVPGNKGQLVSITDARRKPFSPDEPPPFPTFNPPADEVLDELSVVTVAADELDPANYRES